MQRVTSGRSCFKAFYMLLLAHLPPHARQFSSVLQKRCLPDLTSTSRFYYEFPNSSHLTCGVTLPLTPPQDEPPQWLQPQKGGPGVDMEYPDTPLAPAQHFYSYLLPFCDVH